MTTVLTPKLQGQRVQFGATPPSQAATAKAAGGPKQTQKTDTEPKRPPLVRGSVMEGIVRTLKMAFLRPRGWAEIALYFTGIFSWVPLLFHAKHFAEGFMGCDSLFLKRRFVITNLSGAKNSNYEGGGLFGGEKKLKPIEQQTHGSIVQRLREVFSWKAPEKPAS